MMSRPLSVVKPHTAVHCLEDLRSPSLADTHGDLSRKE